MPRIVKGALLQATWTGDKESMIQKHEKAAEDAARQGAQVMLFQELFYGPYLGKYRKTHIPDVKGFWEKYYFRPGNLGYPVFETAVGKVGVYICYDRHFPEGARALGLNGAEMVFIPSATSRGLSEYLWRIEQVSHAVANGYFVGTINRVGIEADIGEDDFYGQSYFADPRGQFLGELGSAHD